MGSDPQQLRPEYFALQHIYRKIMEEFQQTKRVAAMKTSSDDPDMRV